MTQPAWCRYCGGVPVIDSKLMNCGQGDCYQIYLDDLIEAVPNGGVTIYVPGYTFVQDDQVVSGSGSFTSIPTVGGGS